jgi:hypothetical protein
MRDIFGALTPGGRCVMEEIRLKSLKHLVPKPLRTWLNRRRRTMERNLLFFDRVTDWSVLRRLTPYRQDLGGRRGRYIDRFYIEEFLGTYSRSIRGSVAEFERDEYASRFGAGRVERLEILDLNGQNDQRTMAIDLAQTSSAPEDLFDCILCTQTLFLIEDYHSAIQSLYKMLRPTGVVLVTVPGICPIIRGGLVAGLGEDFWRFTARSAKHVFSDIFGHGNVIVQSYGNVLTATAFLHGLVQEELTQDEFQYHDPDYEVIIGVNATKAISK